MTDEAKRLQKIRADHKGAHSCGRWCKDILFLLKMVEEKQKEIDAYGDYSSLQRIKDLEAQLAKVKEEPNHYFLDLEKIEFLEKSLKEAREENARLLKTLDILNTELRKLQEENEKLLAENKRMREGLEKIANAPYDFGDESYDMRQAAKEALDKGESV